MLNVVVLRAAKARQSVVLAEYSVPASFASPRLRSLKFDKATENTQTWKQFAHKRLAR